MPTGRVRAQDQHLGQAQADSETQERLCQWKVSYSVTEFKTIF